MKLFVVELSLTFGLLVGCSVPAAKVVGTYTASNDQGTMTLVLSSDGDFTQRLEYSNQNGGKVKFRKGRWEYKNGDVFLSNGWTINHDSIDGSGGESMPAESWFGGVELVCDPDWSFGYKKVSDEQRIQN